MAKSPDAFRTISEVAEWLDRPAHVLRFWESKFTQIKPVKRAGGRRYYRPQDMLLLGGIKKLLHDDGMTIKGVQKLLRENGVQHVAALSQPLDGGETIEAAPVAAPAPQPEAMTPEPETTDNLVAFKRPEPETAPDQAPANPKPAAEPEQASLFEFPPAAEPAVEESADTDAPEAETTPEAAAEPAPEPEVASEEQVSVESEEQPAAAQAPEAPADEAPAPGILSRILTREAKLPGADLAPILQRVRSHSDALGKASRDR